MHAWSAFDASSTQATHMQGRHSSEFEATQ